MASEEELVLSDVPSVIYNEEKDKDSLTENNIVVPDFEDRFISGSSSGLIRNLLGDTSNLKGLEPLIESPPPPPLSPPTFGHFYLGEEDPPNLQEEGGPLSIETQHDFSDLEQEPHSLEVQPPEPLDQEDLEIMGIANSWTDSEAFGSPPTLDYPIPLPPPGGFEDTYLNSQGPGNETTAPFNSPVPQQDDLYSSNSQLGDVKDKCAVPGVCGMYNLGNTCYMGAGIQCLASTPTIAGYFLHWSQIERSKEKLTGQFALMLHKMWCGEFSCVRPSQFKQSLGLTHMQFNNLRQHDCQEFLALFLDTLHEELNTAKYSFRAGDSNRSSPVAPFDDKCGDEGRSSEGKMDTIPDSTSDVSIPMVAMSESSRSSQASSPRSSDSTQSTEKATYRLISIPEDVKSYQDEVGSDGKPVEQVNEDTLDQDVDMPLEEANNLIPEHALRSNPNLLHSSSSTFSSPEKNEVAALNNQQRGGSPVCGIQDILKDAKTSNVNVLVKEPEANNALRFDSDKFPRQEVTRPREALENLNLASFHSFEDKTIGIKRIKETNLQHASSSSTSVCDTQTDPDLSYSYNNIKRMRLDDLDNSIGEGSGEQTEEHCSNLDNTAETWHSSPNPEQLQEQMEADRHWANHLSRNKSVVVETFQGQFKNTIVCSACSHASVTFEPFMYLSVPLPKALERNISVTLVPFTLQTPTTYLLTVNKRDRVHHLKKNLLTVYNIATEKFELIVAEVLRNHIARILDDAVSLESVNDINRDVYAYVIPLLSTEPDLETSPKIINTDKENGESMECTDGIPSATAMDEPSTSGSISSMSPNKSISTDNDDSKTDSEIIDCRPCTICLEEFPNSMLVCHPPCENFFCDECLKRSRLHIANGGKCPICKDEKDQNEAYVKVNEMSTATMRSRYHLVPIVFRLDVLCQQNNDSRLNLFGHPRLLRLPSRIDAIRFHQALRELMDKEGPYDILFVDGQGLRCSRCIYTEHCLGCMAPSSGEVNLTVYDTVALRFRECSLADSLISTAGTPDCKERRRKSQDLTIHDCLSAFSESETLDDQNPWYCPMCEQNQCATKTLTVWRFPDFLIVYLKRFVFYELSSTKLDNKLIFPLQGLDVSPFLSGPCNSSMDYNLYACVCHYGGVSSGHYTAFAKNPMTSEWNYFNDENVSSYPPREEDYSSAYVLFYERAGTKVQLNLPSKFIIPEPPSHTIHLQNSMPSYAYGSCDVPNRHMETRGIEGKEQVVNAESQGWVRE